jgi:hypothetical protein
MINKRRKRQEIERLLPWHAAGTLSRREAASSSEHLLAIPNSRGCACRKLTLGYIGGAVRPILALPTSVRRSGRHGG